MINIVNLPVRTPPMMEAVALLPVLKGIGYKTYTYVRTGPHRKAKQAHKARSCVGISPETDSRTDKVNNLEILSLLKMFAAAEQLKFSSIVLYNVVYTIFVLDGCNLVFVKIYCSRVEACSNSK